MKRAAIIGSVAAFLALACAGADETTLTEAEAVNEPGIESVEVTDEQGLSLWLNEPEHLAGSFEHEQQRVDFEVTWDERSHTSTLYGQDGALLYRASFDDVRERVELGEGLILSGPPGSLSSGELRWDTVEVMGDLSSLGLVTARPDFALVSDLAAALASRSDIDVSLFPENMGAALMASATGAGEIDHEAGAASELKSHDPTGCGVCHGACVALTLACVAVSWGPWAAFCAIPGIACHAGCAGSACQ